LALIRQRTVEPLAGEADANKFLWRPGALAPQTAQLAGGAVVVLPGFARPGLGATPAPNLDNVWLRRIERRHPIQSITAEIHAASTLGQVALERTQHRGRPIRVVRAGEDVP